MKGNSPNQGGREVRVAFVMKKYAKVVKLEMEKANFLNKNFRMVPADENVAKNCIALPINESYFETTEEKEEDAAWKEFIESTGVQFLPYSTKVLGTGRQITQTNVDLLSTGQKAILQTIQNLHSSSSSPEHEMNDNLIIDRIKNLSTLVCPKKLETFGDDRTLVIPGESFVGQEFDSILCGTTSTAGLGKEKCLEEFWKTLAQINKSKRIVRRGIVDKNSAIRQSGHRLVWPQRGIPETTGPGSPSWIRVTEQGIKQSFDMCRVMFSRGNISEKIRFGSLVKNDEIILDMYAGIGYYTLPALVHGGASHVYACEWNEHAANALKFNIKDNKVEDRVTVLVGDSRSSAKENNLVGVADRISLGLLPSSEGGWRTAVRALKETGGWLHIHGNVPIKEVATWALWTCSRLVEIAKEESRPSDWVVLCHHVEKVKNFAPTVAHYVADIYMGEPSGFSGCEKMNGSLIGAILEETFVECPSDIQTPSCALSPDGVLSQAWMR